MNRTIFGLAATLVFMGGSHAAILQEHFETYSSVGDDMHLIGGSGWMVTGSTIPVDFGNDGAIVILDDYTWDGSDQSATVGGVEQTILGVTSLEHSLAGVGSIGGNPSWAQWEMSYTESTSGFRNDFSIVVDTDAGNLLTISLTPDIANQYAVSWSSDLVSSVDFGFLAEGLMGYLAAGQTTSIGFHTWWDGGLQYELTNAGVLLSTGTLSGLQSIEFTNFAVNWDSSTNGGFGNNSLTIDQVYVVPEPSSALLGLLGVTLAFTRRRRA